MSLSSRYELGPCIGHGGTADVFRARSMASEGFARTVVIKRIRADLERSPEIAAMFSSEAQIVRRLQHGGIAQLLDFGIQDGAPYLVLEHVDGVSLDTLHSHVHANSRALALGEILCLVEQVAGALAYAHRLREADGMPLGLVHRDVTPRNILVSCDGVVKLTDFGLARVGSPLGLQRRTLPGVVKGTFGYMSPEQARGAPIDGRSDQFSLAIVLYELLAGDNPLDEADTLPKALRLLARPLPPLPASVDRELAAIVARACEVEPRRRFATISEFGDALEEWRGRHGVRLSPEALGEAVRRARGEDAPVAMRALDLGLVREPARAPATIVKAPRTRRGLVLAAAAGVLVVGAIGVIAMLRADRDSFTRIATLAPIATTPVPAPPLAPSLDLALQPTPAPPVTPVIVGPGRLKINVLPWAAVSVDGRELGSTPIDVSLAAGSHTIVLINARLGRRKEQHIVVHSRRLSEIKTW